MDSIEAAGQLHQALQDNKAASAMGVWIKIDCGYAACSSWSTRAFAAVSSYLMPHLALPSADIIAPGCRISALSMSLQLPLLTTSTPPLLVCVFAFVCVYVYLSLCLMACLDASNRRVVSAAHSVGLAFTGLYTHAGMSYHCRSVEEIQRIAKQERDVVVAAANA